jgi:hypothetical protein
MPLTVLIPPVSNNLTTAETVARELLLTDENLVVGISELIPMASAACASYCNRVEGFGLAVVRQTERIATARDCIILARDLNVVLAGVVGDYTLGVVEAGTTLGADEYELDAGGLLYRLSDDERTNWEPGLVTITYKAGYALLDDLPWDIERACILTVAEMHAQRGGNPGLRSQNNGLMAETFMTPVAGVPPQAARLLDPWRRFAL